MSYETLSLKHSYSIMTITLNTPHNYNAMSEQLLCELNKVLDDCFNNEAVKVLIICGEGKAFCAGGDIQSMQKGINDDPNKLARMVRLAGDAARKIRQLRKPVIAAVHGSAAGGGCSLALLCDFRIATKDACFIEAFIHLGLVPDMGGVYVLSRYLGLGRLTEYMMIGNTLSATEALSLGVINQIVEKEELESHALLLAKKLDSLPVKALANIKALINQTLFADFDLCLDREVEYQHSLSQTYDYAEGVNAFLHKRKPVFKGL